MRILLTSLMMLGIWIAVPTSTLAGSQAVPTVQEIEGLRARANQGDTAAQVRLGYIYAEGEGVAPAASEAHRWFLMAADSGNAEAQRVMATMYRIGMHVERNDAEAAHWYRLAGAQGDVASQAWLGYMYRNGQGVAQDWDEAAYWYRQAAAQGNEQAVRELGAMGYSVAAPPTEPAEAQRELSVVAVPGPSVGAALSPEPAAQPDVQERDAVQNLIERAGQGDVDAQLSVAFMYSEGLHGLQQDNAQAAHWYQLAAEQGSGDAARRLATAYQTGDLGLAVDRRQSNRWYQSAARSYQREAEGGDAEAQYQLGQLYQHGLGVRRNETRADEWNLRAAQQGHGPANEAIMQGAWDALGQLEEMQRQDAERERLAQERRAMDEREGELLGRLFAGVLVAAVGGNELQVAQALTGQEITVPPPPGPGYGVGGSGGGRRAGSRADHCMTRLYPGSANDYWFRNDCSFGVEVHSLRNGAIPSGPGTSVHAGESFAGRRNEEVVACDGDWGSGRDSGQCMAD